MILSQREKDAYTAWVDSLKEGATITTNDKALEKLTFERVFTQKTADTTDAAEETDENAILRTVLQTVQNLRKQKETHSRRCVI